MPHCILGVDIGTSGLRVAAVDAHGVCHWQAERRYESGVALAIDQQQPEGWWRSFEQLLAEQPPMRREQIAGICCAGTSGTVLLADKHGEASSPALMYHYHASGYLNRAGLPAHLQTAAADRALALQQRYPGLPCSPADWFVWRLTGQRCADYNNALKSGYDPIDNQWPKILAKRYPALCAPLVKPGAVVAGIKPEMARRLQLPLATQIHAGTTDSMAALWATGARTPGTGVSSLGSTLALKLISPNPVFCRNSGVYSHRFGEGFAVSGASNTGGAVLRQYFSDQKLAQLSSQINTTAPDTLGYWPLAGRGERFPVHAPMMRSRITPRPDDPVAFLAGLLRGMARIEALGYQRFAKLGAPDVTRVLTSGGGGANAAFTAIRAGFLRVPVTQAEQGSPAVGAARLAWSERSTDG
ncbi:MAG TPA: carbohydrate kinase [Halothiobacillaceae bacterium]|nr:carbohydrate kinase [Halothiobacillaceae bacterium]